MAAPEKKGQEDHEERVGAEIGCEGKVRVQGRGADFLLHPRQIRCLISN